MDTIFINTENSKTNEPHRFRLYKQINLFYKQIKSKKKQNNIFSKFVHILYVEKYKICL